jgi:hypothetical protein
LRKVYTENNSLDCGLPPDRLIIQRKVSISAAMTRMGHVISKPAAPRKWVGVLVLLAFFLQSLVVQTHIHQPLRPETATAASQQLPAPIKTQDPIDQCRLCQEMVHAGHFVAPSAIAALISLSFVTAISSPLPSLSDRTAPAFSWRSRAPPRR